MQIVALFCHKWTLCFNCEVATEKIMFCDIKSQKGIVRPAASFLTCVDSMDVNGRGQAVPAILRHNPKSKLSMPSTQVHHRPMCRAAAAFPPRDVMETTSTTWENNSLPRHSAKGTAWRTGCPRSGISTHYGACFTRWGRPRFVAAAIRWSDVRLPGCSDG